MSKFQRQYRIEATTKDGEKIVITNPFTLNFVIVRHQLSSAANATLKIYNLGLETRMKLLKNAWEKNSDYYFPIRLYAGYEGMMPLVLRGAIYPEARSYRAEGSPDFMTEVEVYDGGFDMAHGDSNFSVSAGTLRVEAIKRLCKDFPNLKIGAIGNFPGAYARQRVFAGKTKQLIMEETGGNFFIDNEHVYCLKDNEAIEGEVLVISSETGLLGSPSRTKGLVIAEMLFEPRLKVGQVVELVSKDYPSLNQLYKVIGVQHTGTISDAVGGKCKTRVTMKFGLQSFKIVRSES